MAGKRVAGRVAGNDLDKMARAVLLGLALLLVLVFAMKLVSQAFPEAFASVQQKAAEWGLPGTFAIVFLGSTLLPFPTDAWYVSTVALEQDVLLVVAIAVLAAWLAGLVNYFLAYYLSEKWVVKRLGRESIEDAKRWFDRYGGVAIVLFGIVPASPIIDPLTFVAGFTEMDFKKYAVYLLAARIAHFGGLALLASGIISL
ncbi:MAG: VTT domain-containing protein [Candidatus Micrarchaeota archaeon]